MMIIIPFIILFFLCVLDGSFSSLATGGLVLIIGYLLCPKYNEDRIFSTKALSLVSSIYFIIAFIISKSFDDSHFFIVFDSINYINNNISIKQFPLHEEALMACYFDFGDNNGLFNLLFADYSCIGNKFLGGSTVFYLTIFQTCFGILSSIAIYRMLRIVDIPKVAFKYTLIYSLCTLTFFYSCVIIRDIVIVCVYAYGLEIILKKYSTRNLVWLIFLVLIAWGTRLYSGLFMLSFVFYYFYRNIRSRIIKRLAVFITAVVSLVAVGSIIVSDIFLQTSAELQYYTELSNENSGGGIVSKLMTLPPVISQLALVLFAMVKLLPPQQYIVEAETFSNLISAIVYTYNYIIWYVLFYLTLVGFVLKKYYRTFTFDDWILLGLVLVFLFANTTHADIRRMIPVFPVLLVYYLKMKRDGFLNQNTIKFYRKCLLIFYFGIGLLLTIM